MTYAEQRLWGLLRDRRGLKFRRQVRLGRLIADFACYRPKLVVEADGGIHKLRADEDALRDARLRADGFIVLRFSNEAIIARPQDVLAAIVRAARQRGVDTPHPGLSETHLLPQGEKEPS